MAEHAVGAHATTRILYVSAEEARQMFDAFARKSAYFHATRVPVPIGATVDVRVLVDDDQDDVVCVPAMAVGHRGYRPQPDALCAGVKLMCAAPVADAITALSRLTSGTAEAIAEFADDDELQRALERLGDGLPADVPCNARVERGGRLRIGLRTRGEPIAVSVDVVVRSVSLHDGERRLMVVIADLKDAARVDEAAGAVGERRVHA